MALQTTLPADHNPVDLSPLPIYVRAGNVQDDELNKTLSIDFLAFASQAAFEGGKAPIGPLNPLSFVAEPQPARVGRPAIPSYEQIRETFEPEFDFMLALGYELAKRFDPVLQGATDAEPYTDAALAADINARLDAAGLGVNKQ